MHTHDINSLDSEVRRGIACQAATVATVRGSFWANTVKWFLTPFLALSLTPFLALFGFLFAALLPEFAGAESSTATNVPPRGEFVLRHSAAIGRDGTDFRKFCQPFTANLNEFRHLDFETCDARLSPKYPQFSRAAWEEIPLDLDIAKKVLTGRPSVGFERWFKVTETAREAGEVKLWLIKVDLLKDGNFETLVRLDHASDGTQPHCSYYDSKQMITDIPDTETAKWYSHAHFNNRSLLGGDMIYDVVTKRFYVLDWNRRGRVHSGYFNDADIGATASVTVSRASDRGVHAVCWIDWVPTGKRKADRVPPQTRVR